MKYKYILGPSGSGKTRNIMTSFIRAASENFDKKYLLIVPDQYTMQTQKDIVELNSKTHGIMNIDVLSFGRLYYKLSEEIGLDEKKVLDDTGKNLILRRISMDMADELPFLGKRIKMQGVVHEIKSVISEFKQYGICPDDVDKLIDYSQSNNHKALAAKLSDIRKLYGAFETYKAQKYITTEEKLDILAEMIAKSENLSDAVVAFDGFTGFTPVQNRVLAAFLHKTDELWFSLCTEKEAFSASDNSENLYSLTHKTINSIDRLMQKENGIHISDEWTDKRGIRFNNDTLRHLEKNIFRQNAIPYQHNQEAIKIVECKDPREELKNVCIRIKKLIKSNNYAYRDIAVVTGALDVYSAYADEIFGMYDIPCFIDNNRKLVMNPFAEALKGALNIIRNRFSYESVMHFLRTYMTDIKAEDIDRFENYLRALKIRGVKAYKDSFVRIPAYMKSHNAAKDEVSEAALLQLKCINDTRQRLMEMLEPLMPLLEGAHSVRSICVCLYDFIEKNGFDKTLTDYAELFADKGDAARAKEYEQIYKAVMILLEQMVELLGDEQVTTEDYIKLFESGIEEIKIGIIPKQVDYLVMGDIERTRLGNIKVLFFVGVNDGIIPKNSGNGGMISDLDREFLNGMDIELSPSPRQRMFIQKLYLYLNMTKPSEMLFFSYFKVDSDGKAQRKAYLIDEILKLFKTEPEVQDGVTIRLDNIVGKKDAQTYISWLLRKYADGRLCSDEEKELFFALLDEATQKNDADINRLVNAAFYTYHATPLSKAVATMLYGKTLENSISRLERFASCAYSHFLRYGLELEERENFDVSAIDLGNVYHKVLEVFFVTLEDDNLEVENLTTDDAKKRLEEAFLAVVSDYSENIFYQDARNIYRLERMKRILLRTVDTLIFQIGKSAFKPKYFEMSFRHAYSAKELKVGLEDDEKLIIKGRIDRVDTYRDSNNLYVKIVDYKSGNNKIDLIELYNGLSLQLVVYLDQAVRTVKEKNPNDNVVPAGMYYYHVSDPFVPTQDDTDRDQIDEWIRNNLKLSGLSIEDDEVIRKLGGEFEDGESKVLNISTKKNSLDYKKGSEVIPIDDMNTMTKYAEYTLERLGKEILGGNIKARPCRENDCERCPYSEVCEYDKRISGYEDASYEKIDKDTAIDEMKRRLDEGEK